MSAAANSAYAVSVDDSTGADAANPEVPARSGRKRLYVRNNSTDTTVYVSNKVGVTSDDGFPLLPGDVISETRKEGLDCQGAIFAVCASGESAELRVWERD